jgi:hypothetical protein
MLHCLLNYKKAIHLVSKGWRIKEKGHSCPLVFHWALFFYLPIRYWTEANVEKEGANAHYLNFRFSFPFKIKELQIRGWKILRYLFTFLFNKIQIESWNSDRWWDRDRQIRWGEPRSTIMVSSKAIPLFSKHSPVVIFIDNHSQ